MIGKSIYVNLSSLIVKGIVIEEHGEKLTVELEDKSKCVIEKSQVVEK